MSDKKSETTKKVMNLLFGSKHISNASPQAQNECIHLTFSISLSSFKHRTSYKPTVQVYGTLALLQPNPINLPTPLSWGHLTLCHTGEFGSPEGKPQKPKLGPVILLHQFWTSAASLHFSIRADQTPGGVWICHAPALPILPFPKPCPIAVEFHPSPSYSNPFHLSPVPPLGLPTTLGTPRTIKRVQPSLLDFWAL